MVAINSMGGDQLIENNEITVAGGGFYASTGSTATFRNNRLSRVRGTCAALLSAAEAVIAGNRLSACGTGGYYPLFASAEARGRIENNVVLGSGVNIAHLEPGGTAVVSNNRDHD